MDWFKGKDADWWLGSNSWFAKGMQSYRGDSAPSDFSGGVPVQHNIDPMVIYGVGGLVLLKVLKVI